MILLQGLILTGKTVMTTFAWAGAQRQQRWRNHFILYIIIVIVIQKIAARLDLETVCFVGKHAGPRVLLVGQYALIFVRCPEQTPPPPLTQIWEKCVSI